MANEPAQSAPVGTSPDAKPPTYRERKLQRAFCDLTENQKENLEAAQAIFERREGIPARATDIVRNAVREFCRRQGVEFSERRPRAKTERAVADAPKPPLDMWATKESP